MLKAVNQSEGNMGLTNYVNLIAFKNITPLQSKAPRNITSKFKKFPSSSDPLTLSSFPTRSLFILLYLQVNPRALTTYFLLCSPHFQFLIN